MRPYGYERTSLISMVRFFFLFYERQLAFSLLVGHHTSIFAVASNSSAWLSHLCVRKYSSHPFSIFISGAIRNSRNNFLNVGSFLLVTDLVIPVNRLNSEEKPKSSIFT